MAIAFDGSGTPASSVGDFNFVHTPGGTLRGVVVAIVQNVGFTDEVITVTYGGVTMGRAGAVFHGTGETGAVYAYFLGSTIPTGPQTIIVDVNGTGSNKRVTVWGLTAAKDTQLVDVDTTINTDSQVDPTITLSLAGRTCWCGIEFISGQDDPTGITPFANWTATLEQDFGTLTGGSYRYNTVSTVDVSAGWTQTAEDAAMVAIAIGESIDAVVSPSSAMRAPPSSVYGAGAGVFG